MIEYFDAHTHLNDEYLFPRWEEFLQLFREVGGKGLVNIGASEVFNNNAITIAQEYQTKDDFFLGTTIGFHPYEVVSGTINNSNMDEKLQQFEQQYLDHKDIIYAFGECGIDLHYS
ncbi:MAG: hypothetical protein GXP45_01125 [bacterium]|nr:hypothetical protein [bacterium]